MSEVPSESNKLVTINPTDILSLPTISPSHKSRTKSMKSGSFFGKRGGRENSLTDFLMEKTGVLSNQISKSLKSGNLDKDIERSNLGVNLERINRGRIIPSRKDEDARSYSENNPSKVNKLKWLKERRRALRNILKIRGRREDPLQIASPYIGMRVECEDAGMPKSQAGLYTKQYMLKVMKDTDKSRVNRLKYLLEKARGGVNRVNRVNRVNTNNTNNTNNTRNKREESKLEGHIDSQIHQTMQHLHKLQKVQNPQITQNSQTTNNQAIARNCWCCSVQLREEDVNMCKYMLKNEYEYELALQSAMELIETMSGVTAFSATSTSSSIYNTQHQGEGVKTIDNPIFCLHCLAKIYEINQGSEISSIKSAALSQEEENFHNKFENLQVSLLQKEERKQKDNLITRVIKGNKPSIKPQQIEVKRCMNRSLDIGIVRGNRRPSDDVPPRQSLKKNKMEPVISRALRRAHYFTSDISPEAIRHYQNNAYLSTTQEAFGKKLIFTRNKQHFKKKSPFTTFANAVFNNGVFVRVGDYESAGMSLIE